jgi:hypothetical protein
VSDKAQGQNNSAFAPKKNSAQIAYPHKTCLYLLIKQSLSAYSRLKIGALHKPGCRQMFAVSRFLPQNPQGMT